MTFRKQLARKLRLEENQPNRPRTKILVFYAGRPRASAPKKPLVEGVARMRFGKSISIENISRTTRVCRPIVRPLVVVGDQR